MAKRYGVGDIKINDTLVSKSLQKRMAAITRLPIWAYGWKSRAKQDKFCFWHAHFAGGDSNSRHNCEAELASVPELAPIYDLWRALKIGPLRGHEPLRVYANSHTFGVEGQIHTDNKDTENYFSTIYYAHPVWPQRWAGETVFYTRNTREILASVSAKPGRAVTFPGAMPHCARAPSRDCPALRITVVIKTQKAVK